MMDHNRPIDKLMSALQERAKELNCLYRIEEILNNISAPLDEVFHEVIRAIPPGWQHPEICEARIIYENLTIASSSFAETPWVQTTDIVVQDDVVGSLSVYYTREMPAEDFGPFL